MAKSAKAAAKKAAPAKTADTPAESSTATANRAEAKAAQKDERKANKVENKWAKRMSREQAEQVIKQYAGINGTEIAPELEQAREVIKNEAVGGAADEPTPEGEDVGLAI